MTKISNAPERGHGSAPSSERPALRFNDPEQFRVWLGAVHEQILDALAAGRDAARPFSQRVLSRAEVGRKLNEAEAAIEALLDAAKRGLPDDEGTK